MILFPERHESCENPHDFRLEQLQNSAIPYRMNGF